MTREPGHLPPATVTRERVGRGVLTCPVALRSRSWAKTDRQSTKIAVTGTFFVSPSGRHVLPVFFLGRKCGRRSLLNSVFTFIWAVAGAMPAVRAVAQTATPVAQTAQAQAAQDQNSLPPIHVSGNKPKSRGNVKKPHAGAEVHTAPNPVRTPLVPGNVVGPIPNTLVTNPLAGIPATPLKVTLPTAPPDRRTTREV
jgi:hypothetical protein